jgi:type VI secretion system protein ImpL
MNFLSSFINWINSGPLSLPLLIAIILSIAFVTMLLVTVYTLVSMKRTELKAKKIIDLPPSAIRNKDGDNGAEADPQIDENASKPPPFGEWINQLLLKKGYIKVNSVVHSFFKALDFLKSSLGTGYKYKLPWYMVVGTESSGKSSLLSCLTYREICDDESENPGCTWWFLKNGVVLDIKGSFFLPKVGFNSDEHGWQIVLNMLSRYRSAKPLNGLILTIPANELYGKNKLQPEEIKKRALFVARKLNFAQNYLGMRLPVYIVITKTDVVPGFQSFCAEIPNRNRSNMLGWSSPFSSNTIFTTKMLDDAFAFLEDELNEIRTEIFSESSVTTTRDGIFVFPSELLTMKDPLRCYIETIFKSSCVEAKFYFRGFYFTGDSKMIPLLQFDQSNQGDCEDVVAIVGTPDADVNEVGSTTTFTLNESFAPKRIFFFEDLLLKKVFMEDGMATPMLSKIHQTSKSIFVAKVSTAAFVILGSYGLFSAKDKLKQSRDALYPSFFKISSLIKSASDLTFKNLDDNGNEILAECTSQLLAMMQQINNTRFSSAFVPASWFGSIDSSLKETLRASYQKVVVRTIYMNLLLRARTLLNMKPGVMSSKISEVLNPCNSKEYSDLKGYVFDLIELEKHIKKFDSLRTSADPQDLNDLINYTFHGSLPQEFLATYPQFRSILMNTPFPSINLTPYKQTAYDVLINLFQSYLDAIFTVKSKNSVISILNRFIDQLSHQQIKKIPDFSEMRKFAEDLEAVCTELGEEGKTWLDNDIFVSDKDFDSFLDGVETLFGKDIAQKLLDAVAVNFGYLKSKLSKFNNAINHTVEDDRKPGQNSVSSGIFLLNRCLSTLCAEPFMEPAANYHLITEIPEEKMIFWDDDLVQQAYEIGQQFIKFSTTTIKDFPKAMRDGILLMAKSNMSTVIASTIAKAQSIVDAPMAISSEITSEEILQSQVSELKGVAPKFVSLLKILRDDKLSFVFGNLRVVLNKVAFALLARIDSLLDKQTPYCPQDLSFKFWNGETGASFLAFSASDSEELLLYTNLQRSIIERLALDFASIIVDFLNSEVVFDQNYGDHKLLTKWTRIVEHVRSFRKKNPSSSMSIIERFIRHSLNGYTIDNITTRLSKDDIKEASGDYFLNIVKEIKKCIMARAEILLRKRNIERYKTLADYYTKHLDGRFPFSNYDKTQRTANDADLEAVREFFKMYDDFGGTPESILDQIYQLGGEADTLYVFIKKIHEIRQFFGDSLGNNHREGVKISLEADFDINKRAETNTNYLVDRIFQPNSGAKIEAINEDKQGTWYFGDPTSISFRWARGDPQAPQPIYNPNDPDVLIQESTAQIECVGNWSILRFLQKYKAEGTSADQTSPNQMLLCFPILLNNSKIAKLYFGVTAFIPKKPGVASLDIVKIPILPPGEMPAMPSSVMAVNDEAVLVSRVGVTVQQSGLLNETEMASTRASAGPNAKSAKPTQNGNKKQKSQPNSQRQIEAILENSEDSQSDDEVSSIIEISEEPID